MYDLGILSTHQQWQYLKRVGWAAPYNHTNNKNYTKYFVNGTVVLVVIYDDAGSNIRNMFGSEPL